LVIDSQAYVGLGSDVSGGAFYSDFYRFDPNTNSYTTLQSSPLGRNGAAHFVIGSLGYVGLGLIDSSGINTTAQDFTTYSPSTNSWSQINNFGGVQRSWVFSETVGGLPFVGAGSSVLNHGLFYTDNWTWNVCNLNINLGTDTALCSGSSLTLRDTTSGATFLWNTGATTSSINVTSTGQYWLQVTQGTCVGRDTINVSFSNTPATFSLGNDTTYCGNFTRLLSTGNVNTHWSTGVVGSSISVTSPGLYWANIVSSCGTESDSITLSQKTAPVVELGNDTVLCYWNSLILKDTASGASFLWSTGETSPNISVDSTGSYWINVNANGCNSQDTISINFINAPIIKTLVSDTIICAGSPFILDVHQPFASYRWNNGAITPTITVSQSGQYSVTITNACGSVSGFENVAMKECTCRVDIPTAFSPNNDGVNDRYGILTQCPISNFKIEIYDRWGQLVYVGIKCSRQMGR
jgi:hypothetical protein